MVQHVSVEAVSSTPASELYALLKEPTTWTSWSPMDESGPDQPAAGDPNGVGSTRTFTKGRVRGIDRVVELIPDRRFSYAHVRGLPVRDYRGDVDLEPVSDGTRIVWQASFRPKLPGTGWIWRLGIRRFLQQMADGLATAATTSPSPSSLAGRPSSDTEGEDADGTQAR